MEKTKIQKVFICHSSDDKERFVTGFAKRLRKEGVDAWLDNWEILIGDSLVNEVFENGIKECDIFMPILSKTSIEKNWVKNELETGIIRKIEEHIRIMPVIIDNDIEIPTALHSTKWQKINDVVSYDKEFREIVNSILGITEKPELGKQAKYVTEISRINDLSQIDSFILKVIIEYVLNNIEWTRLISGADLEQVWIDYNLSEDEVKESLEVLNEENYINILLTTSGFLRSPITIEINAILDYAENYINNYDIKLTIIISDIINNSIRCSNKLSENSELNIVIVNSLLEYWKKNNYFQLLNQMDIKGNFCYQGLTTMGKRFFNEKLNQ